MPQENRGLSGNFSDRWAKVRKSLLFSALFGGKTGSARPLPQPLTAHDSDAVCAV
jgi:hypothetical protein